MFLLQDEENVVLNSFKRFDQLNIDTNLKVDSNTINDTPLENLLTKDTPQELSFENIKGNVTIENLEITGLLDNMDISKEFENIVKINEDAIIESQIIFDNNDRHVDIYSKELKIGTLNENQNKTSFIPNADTNEVILNHEVFFENLKADEVYIDGDFNGEIYDFDLKYFDENRFSVSREQNVTGEYTVGEGVVNDVDTANINDIATVFIEPFVDIDGIMTGKFYSNNLDIDGKWCISE